MRSALAPLSLEGVGTSLIESLASYFLRLTLVHQVRPGQLSQVVCNDSPYLRVSAHAPVLKYRALYPAMLCSYSQQTEVIALRLAKLTGEKHLRLGTLLRLRGQICRNQTGAIVVRRRWCPQCYAEARTEHIVEPLAWSIPLIDRCPEHGVLLEQSCTHCGASQLAWHIGADRRRCRKCGQPLHGTSAGPSPTPWQEWCQREMLRLLQHMARPDSSGFSVDAVCKFLEAVPVWYPGADTYRQPLSNLRRNVQKHPATLPRLNTLFLVAACWGTTPLDILVRPLEAATPCLFDDEVPLPRPPSKRLFHARNYQRCERRLRALMRLPDEILLPPGGHIQCECRVSNSFQMTRSVIWRKYMDERRRRAVKHKESQIVLANRFMKRLLAKLIRSGQPLHRRNAITQLQRDIGVSKTVARSALRVCLLNLRLDRSDS